MLLDSSLAEKLLVALLGELAIVYAGSGGGGKKESDADVALVLEYDRVVDGREDEKLLFRSFLNMLPRLCVFVYSDYEASTGCTMLQLYMHRWSSCAPRCKSR